MKSNLFPSTLLSLELKSQYFDSFFDHICNATSPNHSVSRNNRCREVHKEHDHQHNDVQSQDQKRRTINRGRTRQSSTRIKTAPCVSTIMIDLSKQLDQRHYYDIPTPSISSKDTAITEASTVSSSTSISSSCSLSSGSVVVTGILKNKRSVVDSDTRDSRYCNSHRNNDSITCLPFRSRSTQKSIRFTKDTKPAAPTTIYPAKRPVKKNKNLIQKKQDDEVALLLAYLRNEGILTSTSSTTSLYATTKTPLIMLPPVFLPANSLFPSYCWIAH
jgi:hypothetical protein